MSLLIKALDKAQEQAQLIKLEQVKSKQAQHNQNNNSLKNSQADSLQLETDLAQTLKTPKIAKSESLSLESIAELPDQTHSSGADLQQAISPKRDLSGNRASLASKITPTIINASAISAANVFNAKQPKPSHQNKTIYIFGLLALITLVAIGVYFYMLNKNNYDAATIIAPSLATNLQIADTKNLPNEIASTGQLPAFDVQKTSAEPLIEPNFESSADIKAAELAIEKLQLAQKKEQAYEKSAKQSFNKVINDVNADAIEHTNIKDLSIAESSMRTADSEFSAANSDTTENSLKSDEILIAAKIFKNKANKKNNNIESPPLIASKSASMNITRTQSQNSINPVLMRAFDAYNAGKDDLALKLYKQVLQRDVRNSDALLGLGAIAQRQGRLADANGWYGKVLEVDPKNSTAISFLLNNQQQNQPQNQLQNQNDNTETQLKNMLAIQPNDANLHALLGNFYAQNNQWPAAQQAYFDAFRLNASAHNALNLAVTLDQMGKPALALPYYQQALALDQNQTQIGSSQIDKSSIEARIKAIN